MALNTVQSKTKKEHGGVLLTPQQQAIADRKVNFLAVAGLPGTGKTYCLAASVVRIYQEIEGEKDSMILVMHNNRTTRQYIEELVLSGLPGHCADQRIRFLDPRDEGELDRVLGMENMNFHVFHDDHVREYHLSSLWSEQHRRLLSRAESVFYTTYAVPSSVPSLSSPTTYPYRPSSEVRENNEFAVLQHTLRNSCHVADFARDVDDIGDISDLLLSTSLIQRDTNLQFLVGHRVIGPQVKVIASPVDNFVGTIEAELAKIMELTSLTNVWLTSLPFDHVELNPKFRQCRFEEVSQYRGLETECIVICVRAIRKADEFWSMMLEGSTWFHPSNHQTRDFQRRALPEQRKTHS